MYSMYPLSNSKEIHVQNLLYILLATIEKYIYKVFYASPQQLRTNTYTKCSMYPFSNFVGIHIQCIICILTAI